MLNGFEDITKDLSPKEKKLAPMVLQSLELNKIITNNEIAGYVRIATGEILKDSTIRKIISYLRTTDAPHICANSNGYYLAKTKRELEVYLISARQRVSQQLMAIHSAEGFIRQLPS